MSLGRLSLRRLNKPDVAIAHFSEARTLAAQIGEPAKEADALVFTAQAQVRRTLYSDAVTTLGQAQAIYKTEHAAGRSAHDGADGDCLPPSEKSAEGGGSRRSNR